MSCLTNWSKYYLYVIFKALYWYCDIEERVEVGGGGGGGGVIAKLSSAISYRLQFIESARFIAHNQILLIVLLNEFIN